MVLKNRVKEYRSKMNINQQQLGEIVGASRQTISSIERGDYSPSIVLALNISKVFGVPVEEIFMIEEDER